MLQAYSLNVDVPAETAVPFKNVTVDKGCSTELSGDSTIRLNECGVYKVHFDGSSSASTTVQLYVNGVAQPQAQSTGASLGFDTLVQVPTNNCNCPCASPITIQVLNVADAAATLVNANILVTKEV